MRAQLEDQIRALADRTRLEAERRGGQQLLPNPHSSFSGEDELTDLPGYQNESDRTPRQRRTPALICIAVATVVLIGAGVVALRSRTDDGGLAAGTAKSQQYALPPANATNVQITGTPQTTGASFIYDGPDGDEINLIVYDWNAIGEAVPWGPDGSPVVVERNVARFGTTTMGCVSYPTAGEPTEGVFAYAVIDGIGMKLTWSSHSDTTCPAHADTDRLEALLDDLQLVDAATWESAVQTRGYRISGDSGQPEGE